MQNQSTRYIIRLIIGGYLLYLAYQLFQGMSGLTGAEKILIPAAAALFVAVGLGIIVQSIRGVKRLMDMPEETDEEAVDEERE